MGSPEKPKDKTCLAMLVVHPRVYLSFRCFVWPFLKFLKRKIGHDRKAGLLKMVWYRKYRTVTLYAQSTFK